MKQDKIVIVGAGVAGINAATKLVDNGYPGELITIIDKGSDPHNRLPEEVIEPLNSTPHEDIAACTNALNAITEYDYAMLDEEEKELVRMIKKMALFLLVQTRKSSNTKSLLKQVNVGRLRGGEHPPMGRLLAPLMLPQ